MLDERHQLSEERIDTITGVIRTQADHLLEMLQDLVRTADPVLMATLDDLNRQTRG